MAKDLFFPRMSGIKALANRLKGRELEHEKNARKEEDPRMVRLGIPESAIR